MTPIAICLDRVRGHYVGGFRILDDAGMATDEVLYCETPMRTSRAHAIADAIVVLRDVLAACGG